jgi:hypothetical protein
MENQETIRTLMEGSLALIIFSGWYFLPTIIALVRKHGNTLAIFIFNLLLGWTLLMWLVALIWAFTNNQKMSNRQQVIVINRRS